MSDQPPTPPAADVPDTPSATDAVATAMSVALNVEPTPNQHLMFALELDAQGYAVVRKAEAVEPWLAAQKVRVDRIWNDDAEARLASPADSGTRDLLSAAIHETLVPCYHDDPAYGESVNQCEDEAAHILATPSGRLLAEARLAPGREAALEAAARDYLAHDGSGIREKGEWAGDYDAIRHGETLRALRAALQPPAAQPEMGAKDPYEKLVDGLRRGQPETGERLSPILDDESDQMCPNCVTPWKCNGPHIPVVR